MTQENRERTLLIDGDVVAFRASEHAQHNEDDGFGYVRPFASIVECKAKIDNMILTFMDGLGATHIQVALTDPESNWRTEVMPTYKANRSRSVVSRPLLLARAKEYLRTQYGAFHWPSLEADDVLGILATTTEGYAGERIVVGRDKDFKTIPGLHWTIPQSLPGVDHMSFEPYEVTPESGKRYHMQQTLSGDRVDGYYGCKGVGDIQAERLMQDPVRLVPEKGVITRGPNKGKDTVKWMPEPTADLWACVVSHYLKAGQTEAEALRNARVSRILLAEDYDMEKQEIRLWTPERLL